MDNNKNIHTETTNNTDIALINFNESTYEQRNHYDALIIEGSNSRKIEILNK
jgi:hypothetical protein